MRYLKPYKLFESSYNEVESDIKDIFLDLGDIGFSVLVDAPNNYYGAITIEGEKLFTINSEIIESILRLVDYLRINRLYLNQIVVTTNCDFHASDITEEGIFVGDDLKFGINSDSKIKQIRIKYSKENI